METFELRSTDGALVLSAPTADDVDRITDVCQEPDIQFWTTMPSPYRRSDAENFVTGVVPASWTDGSPVWAIRDDGGRRLVGMIGLDGAQDGKAEIGYWLAAEARRRGVMSTAVGLVLDAGFDRFGLHAIAWRADLGNWPSWRAVWRHGFRKEGTVRALNHSRGEWKDGWIGTLLKDDPRTPAAPWDGPDGHLATAGANAGDSSQSESALPAVAAPSPRDPDALVRQFHETYHLPVVADAPSVDRDRVHMRMALVAEELAELVEAVYGESAGAEVSAAFTRAVAADDGTRDTVEAADALGDLIYVVYGMALECGIPLDEVLAEIQASNLSKLGQDGRPIYREDGKVLKGPGFFAPDIAGVLARHGFRPKM